MGRRVQSALDQDLAFISWDLESLPRERRGYWCLTRSLRARSSIRPIVTFERRALPRGEPPEARRFRRNDAKLRDTRYTLDAPVLLSGSVGHDA
jgi:hypothetical protein